MIFLSLLALFIILPLAELALLLKVGEWMGVGNTVALVVLTGLVGATLARREGLRVLRDMQRDLGEGRMPAPYLLDGLMILVAGALLLTPGLITDSVGFMLLLPPCRAWLKKCLRSMLEQRLATGRAQVTYWEW